MTVHEESQHLTRRVFDGVDNDDAFLRESILNITIYAFCQVPQAMT